MIYCIPPIFHFTQTSIVKDLQLKRIRFGLSKNQKKKLILSQSQRGDRTDLVPRLTVFWTKVETKTKRETRSKQENLPKQRYHSSSQYSSDTDTCG